MAAFYSSAALGAVALVLRAAPAGAHAFLRALPPPTTSGDDLLDELEAALGIWHRKEIDARLSEIEAAILPTYRALPKLSSGRLSAASSRYLLHRFFASTRNWYVRGFDNGGDAWDAASPTSVFQVQSSGHAGEIFERRLDGEGLSLRETAALAATLESLAQEEDAARLCEAYRVAGVGDDGGHPDEAGVEAVVDAYMVMYMTRANSTQATAKSIMPKAMSETGEWFGYWPATRRWIRDVREDVASRSSAERTSLEVTSQVVEDLTNKYGLHAHQECLQLKHRLAQIQQGEVGRVPLHKFYGSALNGSYEFSESKSYLRIIGALDETDPLRPQVIIPNYVLAPSNCMAGTHFYSVCCINECDAILGKIEQQVGGPYGRPRQISDLVEQLASATVAAPRTLPAALIERLEESVAQEGSGMVPLHGRLFSQWLHHAYPLECPFPHVSGGVSVEGRDRKIAHDVETTLASEAEMREHCAAAQPAADGGAAPWLPQEELFLEMPRPTPRRGRGVAFLALAVSMSWAMLRGVGGAAVSAARRRRKIRLL